MPTATSSGWLLAALLVVYVFLLAPTAALFLAILGALALGGIFRVWAVTCSPMWGRLGLVGGLVLVFSLDGMPPTTRLLGELAGMSGAMFLLRPTTPARGLKVLLCLLIMLTAILLKPYPPVGLPFVLFNVIAFLFLAEHLHRPTEAAISLWVSLARSLRVVVPVSLVVSLIFWLFPNLSLFPTASLSGFSGANVLDPGAIAELVTSRRVAFEARFAKGQEIPRASDLYWRGQVLEENSGLRWTRITTSIRRNSILQEAPPPASGRVWIYSQAMTSNRSGVIATLDHPIFADARRLDQDIVVIDSGAGVLSASGSGGLMLKVVASKNRMSDEPLATIAQGCLESAKNIDPRLHELAESLTAGPTTTAAALTEVSGFFRTSGFFYTQRPGRIGNLSDFLFHARRGFCEHYAAAAASLLRLGGIPARVVTGYRGGEWNPWLRKITVRDSDAHAWVEAWDTASGEWLRYDPTNDVAPDLAQQISREMDFTQWPWYRVAVRYSSTIAAYANEKAEATVASVLDSPIWKTLQPVMFGLVVLLSGVIVIRRLAGARNATAAQRAIALMARLEKKGGRFSRERRAGETPLAWLTRLADRAGTPLERSRTHAVAQTYAGIVYAAVRVTSLADLQSQARALCKTWKN